METTQRCNPGVVDQRACDAPFLQGVSKFRPVAIGFGQEDQTRGLQPGLDLVDGTGQESWRRINPGMGYDGQELVQTRPGDSPQVLPSANWASRR